MILPQDMVNRALDAIGAGTVIGALSDGTAISEVARRAYVPTLRQLLRAAHWSFARRRGPLLLLADASGQTRDLATGQPISAEVESPWTYCYAWPGDGVQPRWLPYSPAASGGVPLMTNLSAAPPVSRPARFLLSSTDKFPAITGQTAWDDLPDLPEGQGLIGRRVVLTDVPQAELVYTRLVTEIEEWDSLFEQAFVTALGERLVMPALVDPALPPPARMAQHKMALAVRGQQMAIAKEILREARAASANEAGFPQTIDREPDWLRARRSGGGQHGYYSGDGPGSYWCGWRSFGFSDGSVF